MPSQAYLNFENNLLDEVTRIIESHRQLNFAGKGKRGLGHITRSGVLMLCAAWEVYIEDLLKESVEYFCNNEITPKRLPKIVQKELSRYVKNSNNELKPLELAGEGWKLTYLNDCNESISIFNTPKSTNIDNSYKRFLGIKSLSNNWSLGQEIINKIVIDRGEIAHKGREAKYISIKDLNNYLIDIKKTAIETDNYVADYLQNNCSCNRAPWRRRYIE